MNSPARPLIAITVDVTDPAAPGQDPKPRAQSALSYSRTVAQAGGIPLLLPPLVELIPAYIEQFDGFIFSGGDDPRTEAFGEPTHPEAVPLHPIRQEFELALLAALDRPASPAVLGICLGMQLMSLHAGGSLDQHMPDTVPTAADHIGRAVHRVRPLASSHVRIVEGDVTSHHRQAVRGPGRLRVIAAAPDGVIEAVADPARPFYVGVQWHPEQTASPDLGVGLVEQFVRACAERRRPRVA